MQVLLVDGSTFTVGPGSSLVIDKCVYNPATGKGALVATFSKGALSKNDPGVVVKTPAGALTVRGGIFSAKVNSANSALFAFVFGDSLSLRRDGRLYSTKLAGNIIAVAGGGAVVRPQTTADVNLLQAALNGKSWKKSARPPRPGARLIRNITAFSRPAPTPTSLSSGNGITTAVPSFCCKAPSPCRCPPRTCHTIRITRT